MLTETTEKSNLTLIQRAELARTNARDRELVQAAAPLLRMVRDIFQEPNGIPEWAPRGDKRVPVVRVSYPDGDLVFAHYSDEPPGVYLAALCDECGGGARPIVHDLAELIEAIESKHLCAACANKREAREGNGF